MHRTDKERAVAELTEQLQQTTSLIVADYRGLTNVQLGQLRGKLREHGATFTVVKNTLARRAADATGTEPLLELLSGPTAIAFVSTEGDPVAVAKALADTARETKILTFRGGLLEGRAIDGPAVDELAKLPPLDVLKGQVVGVIVAPLTQLLGLVTAPLQNLVSLIDARLEQLQAGAAGGTAEPAAPDPADAPAETAASAAPEAEAGEAAEEPPDAQASDAPAAEADAAGATEPPAEEPASEPDANDTDEA